MFLKLLVIGCLVATEMNYVMSAPQGDCSLIYFCRYLMGGRPVQSNIPLPTIEMTKTPEISNSAVGKTENDRFWSKFGALLNEPINEIENGRN
jgi:hypothetical protein